MKDTKKSKRSDDASDIDNLFDDIGDAEKEADEQIEELEKNRDEIKALESKLESLNQKLSEMEGEARAAVEADVQQGIQEKEQQAEECEKKLGDIASKMVEKQSEIKGEIAKRDAAHADIESAETECDADLSDAKDAVNGEKEQLEEANEQIEALNEKIDEALKKKVDDISVLEKISNSISDVVNKTVDLARKGATSMTIFTSIVGGLVGLGKTYDNIVSPVQDLIERIVVNNLPKDSVPAQIKDTFDKAKEAHGISSPLDELGAWQDIKSKRDEKEYEQFLKKEERLKKQRENDYV